MTANQTPTIDYAKLRHEFIPCLVLDDMPCVVINREWCHLGGCCKPASDPIHVTAEEV